MQRILFNFFLAMEAVAGNKLRAILTALGIVFGVAAVIAMLAIGTGAKQSILEQMKLIGTNNILVEAVMPDEQLEAQEGSDEDSKLKWSPGLSLLDLTAIEEALPTVSAVSPEIILPVPFIYGGKLEKGQVVGVTNAFFELNNLGLVSGNTFHATQLTRGKPVCVIGQNLVKQFFPEENPLGKLIKCGQVWLRIVGVLEAREGASESAANLGIRDYNDDVFIPINTALLYYKNRGKITKASIASGRGNNNNDNKPPDNPHQLDRFVVQVSDSDQLQATADVLSRLLYRRHRQVTDYEITVPRLLLEQQQRTQDTFNLVLAVIAGISLLVGGIGIMNIMLASVLERIKEVGIRRSLGATRQDITQQFLFEAIFISLFGGIAGIILGVVSANTIASYADIPTVVSTWSVLLSFGVAASVGLVFGLFPAQKAAEQDPIKALRSD